MKKRWIAAILSLCMTFPMVAQAKTVEFTIGSTTVNTFENQVIESWDLPAAPYIVNDRTMVPVRALSESFGASVTWLPDTRNILIESDTQNITLTVDSTEAQVNGEKVILDVAPTIVGDITFVPARFVTESMGYYVSFAGSTSSVLVNDMPHIAYVNGVPLTFTEYETLLYLYMALAPSSDPSSDALSHLLQNTILTEEGKKLGLSLSEDDIASIRNAETYPGFLNGQIALYLEKEFMRDLFLRQLIDAAIAEGTYDSYYQENYLCAKHILVSGTDEASKKKADELYERAIAGEDFDALITEYGEDPGMFTNPQGYVFTSGEMVVPFEEGTRALQENEISKPVLTDYGYHIIQRLPLPAMSDDIALNLVWEAQVAPIIQSAVITQS